MTIPKSYAAAPYLISFNPALTLLLRKRYALHASKERLLRPRRNVTIYNKRATIANVEFEPSLNQSASREMLRVYSGGGAYIDWIGEMTRPSPTRNRAKGALTSGDVFLLWGGYLISPINHNCNYSTICSCVFALGVQIMTMKTKPPGRTPEYQ